VLQAGTHIPVLLADDRVFEHHFAAIGASPPAQSRPQLLIVVSSETSLFGGEPRQLAIHRSTTYSVAEKIVHIFPEIRVAPESRGMELNPKTKSTSAGEARLRLVLLSDTHRLHCEVDMPAGDVLIHARDFMMLGKTNTARPIGLQENTIGESSPKSAQPPSSRV
jgi:hypothetical protein